MQWMSNVVVPGDGTLWGAQWRGKFRSLVAFACLFCFLFAVIAVSDSHFSVRKSPQGGHSCKILKGCLDSENESRRIPAALIVESYSEFAVPVFHVVALVSTEAVVPVTLLALVPAPGRAPPSNPA
jgi:hypothetical protein